MSRQPLRRRTSAFLLAGRSGHRAVAAVAFAAAFVALALTLSATASPHPLSTRELTRALCGTERWSVKVMTDPAASSVSLSPRSTTIVHLRSLTAPVNPSARYGAVERTTYRVHALLKEAKVEADQDIHLVIADPTTGKTMIVEFPASSCTVGASSAVRTRMAAARAAFISACAAPSSTRFHRLSGTATVSGVGFFDRIHGQAGVAPNGIELHPVLGFTRVTC